MVDESGRNLPVSVGRAKGNPRWAIPDLSRRTWMRKPTARDLRGTVALTLAFCISFQFFFSSGYVFDNHPLAPRLFMEATYGFLLLFSTFVVFYRLAHNNLTQLDLFFYLTPLFLMLASVFFAWINYGQPPIYGISEERRCLSYLFWFVFDVICRRYHLDRPSIFRALVSCALIYLVLSLLIQQLAPGMLLARDIPDLDERKLRITSPADSFAICLLYGVVCLATRESPRRFIFPTLIGLAGLVLVAQSRNVTVTSLVTAALSLAVLRPITALKMGIFGGVAVAAISIAMNIDPFTPLLNILLPNISELTGTNLSDNPRSRSLQIVWNLLMDNYFFGLGAVSIMFDGGGLQRFYGRHFWINDVGFFGELFRIGFLWFGFFIVFIRMFFSRWLAVDRFSDRAVSLVILFFFLLQGLTGGFLFRLGHVHAFLFIYLATPLTPRFMNRPVHEALGRAYAVRR